MSENDNPSFATQLVEQTIHIVSDALVAVLLEIDGFVAVSVSHLRRANHSISSCRESSNLCEKVQYVGKGQFPVSENSIDSR